MKKVIIGIALVAVCLYVATWVVAFATHHALDARAWPDKLGKLDEAPNHFPDVETNPAALGLTQLTPSLGINITPKLPGLQEPNVSDDWRKVKPFVGSYYTEELGRTNERILPPPAEVVAYLSDHRAEIDRVRDHILNAGPIVWVTHFQLGWESPLPNLLGHMDLTKLFTSRALMKATAGDVTAWEDLHAVWLLNRGLFQRPDLISQLIALAAARMVNTSAAKMPMPAPSWLSDVQGFDYRHHFVASQQAEAWAMVNSWKKEMRKKKLTYAFAGGYLDASASSAAEKMRVATITMAETSNCDLSKLSLTKPVPWNVVERLSLPNIASVWQRVFRFSAEIEATQKALAIRSGQRPSTTSKCSDGTWAVTESGAAFSRDIATSPQGPKYPLAYRR